MIKNFDNPITSTKKKKKVLYLIRTDERGNLILGRQSLDDKRKKKV